MQKWGWRAKLIADFMDAHKEEENKRWIFIRYENLIKDIIPTAEWIFQFIGVQGKVGPLGIAGHTHNWLIHLPGREENRLHPFYAR